jgi:hypothetical protein
MIATYPILSKIMDLTEYEKNREGIIPLLKRNFTSSSTMIIICWQAGQMPYGAGGVDN